jgi:hypothetical protein
MAVDGGKRHGGIVDDAVDDHLADITRDRDAVGSDLGDLPRELLLTRKAVFGRMDANVVQLHGRSSALAGTRDRRAGPGVGACCAKVWPAAQQAPRQISSVHGVNGLAIAFVECGAAPVRVRQNRGEKPRSEAKGHSMSISAISAHSHAHSHAAAAAPRPASTGAAPRPQSTPSTVSGHDSDGASGERGQAVNIKA